MGSRPRTEQAWKQQTPAVKITGGDEYTQGTPNPYGGPRSQRNLTREQKGWVTTALQASKPKPVLPKGWQWQKKQTNVGEYNVAKRWTPPDYEPSYWENPQNVSKWYKAYKDGSAPDWVDERIEQAYDYMKFANQGAEDSGWRYLNPTDPGREFLQQLETPPLDVVLPSHMYQDVLVSDMMQRPTSTWTEEDYDKLSDYNRERLEGYAGAVQETEAIEDAPWWQQAYLGMSSTPWAMGAIQAGGLGGLGGLVTGGPIGAAAGAVGGGVLGGTLGALSSLPAGSPLGEFSRGAMNLLDMPWRQVERAYGTTLQYMAPDRPYLGHDLERLAEELEAAWWAAGVTTEAGAPFEMSTDQLLSPMWATGQVMKVFGYEDQLDYLLKAYGAEGGRGRFDPMNLVQVSEWALRKGLAEIGFKGWDPGQLEIAGLNQTFAVETIETVDGTRVVSHPVDVGYVGMSALTEARQRILAGENPAMVEEEMKARFGVSGAVTDLAYGIVFDPLNIAPDVGTKIPGRIMTAAGFDTIGGALMRSSGPVEAIRRYQADIRAGVAGSADQLTKLQRVVARLDVEGRIIELQDYSSGRNLVQRAVAFIRELTPSSKARVMHGMMSENVGNLLLHAIDDPTRVVEILETIATKRPKDAAKIAGAFGAPEMYTGQRVIAAFMETAKGELGRWNDEAAAAARDSLRDIADGVGMEVPEFVKLLNDVDDIDNLITQIRKKAEQGVKNPETQALATALLEKLDTEVYTPDDIKVLQDLFTGKNPAPWSARKWAAQLFGKYEDFSAKFLAQSYGLAPDHSIFRIADTLKKAQSFLLLGLNPSYLFNNVSNNMLMRAVGGIFGFASERKIDRYWREIGMEPSRSEAGVGAAGILPEEKIGLPVEGEVLTTSGAGEKVFRSKVSDKGVTGWLNRRLQSLNKLGIISEASMRMESMESKQAFYFAHKKDWNGRWKRGVGFRVMDDPELMAVLREIDPDLPEGIYRMVEASRTEGQLTENLQRVLDASYREYLLEHYLPDTARDMGVDLGLLKDDLNPFSEELREGLKNAKNPEDVRRVFRDIGRQAQDHADKLNALQLRDRAKEIAETVKAGGWMEAVKLLNDMSYEFYEYSIKNAINWQHTYDLANEMRANGASPDTVNALFKEKTLASNAEARRLRSYSQAAYLGVLDAWGVADESARLFADSYKRQDKVWADYYRNVQRRRDEVHRTQYATSEQAIAAWQALEMELHESFLDTQMRSNEIARGMDDLYTDVVGKQFGDGAGIATLKWREQLRNLEDVRQEAMRAHRESMLNERADVRRQKWPEFYDETYMPMLRDHYDMQRQAMMDMYNELTGRQAPPAEPPIAPEPPPIRTEPPARQPAPEEPPAGGAAVSPEPDIDIPPGEAPAPTFDELRSRLVGLAHEYGMEQLTKSGKERGITARLSHAYNILRKYGGEEIRNLDQSDLLQLPDDQIRDIFDAYRQDKQIAAENAAKRQARNTRVGYLRGTVGGDLVFNSIDEQPPHIQDAVRREAGRMQAELPEQVSRTWDYNRETNERYSISPNPAWYNALYFEHKLNKQSVVNALQRIIDGGGRDVPKGRMLTLQRVKEVVIDHLLNGVEEHNFPPDIGMLYHFGDEASVVDAVRMMADESPDILDTLARGEFDENMAGLFGTEENFNRTRSLLEGDLPEVEDPIAPSKAEVRADQRAAEDVVEGYITRQNAREYIVDEYLSHTENHLDHLGDTTEMADGLMEVLEAHAEVWAAQYNSTPEAWYREHLAGVRFDAERPRGVSEGTRGAVEFLDDHRAIIVAYGGADLTTFIHEVGHIFLYDLPIDDYRIASEWVGAGEGNWTTGQIERFAEGFERYMLDGRAPTAGLQAVFTKFANWIAAIYDRLMGGHYLPDLTPEMRGVYDRLLAIDPEIRDPDFLRPPEPEPSPTTFTRGGQGTMFPAGEDTPLFTGTPMRGEESAFRPTEEGRADIMPGFEDAYRPQMEGAREGGEAAGPLFEGVEDAETGLVGPERGLGDDGRAVGQPDTGGTGGVDESLGTIPREPTEGGSARLADAESPDIVGVREAEYVGRGRPELTRTLGDERVINALREEELGQATDARRILSAFDRGESAYVLANGTGTGKTFVALGVLLENKSKKALVVVPSKPLANQTRGYARDFFQHDIDIGNNPPDSGIWVTTYAKIRGMADQLSGYDHIVFDESHKLKKYGIGNGSKQANAAAQIVRNNPDAKTLYMSATPFQSLTEMKYLENLGMWDKFDDLGFDRFLADHGYNFIDSDFGGYWRFEGDIEDILDVYKEMSRKGVISQRELAMDVDLQNEFVSVPLRRDAANSYAQINNLFDTAVGQVGSRVHQAIVNAQRTIALRRVMELSKVDDAIRLAKEMLDEGRQVAIFTGYRNEAKAPRFKARGLRHINDIMARIYDTVDQVETQSIQRLIDDLGGESAVAQVHGGVSPRMRILDIDDYQNGKKKVLVATAAAGGTGLSLHDVSGGAPRAQINVYLPWSGQDFQQVAGRSYRYGSQTDVKQYWLFSDTPKEAAIAGVVGSRLAEMGALVRGVASDADATKIAAFDFGVLDSPAGERFFQGPKPVEGVGRTPPGTVENMGAPEYSGMHEGDIWLAKVQPLLQTLEGRILKDGPVTGKDVNPTLAEKIAVYGNKVKGDMATSRMASFRYAEQQRDFALLNYSRRRGADQLAQLIYPYQYWYTRSLFNWALRAFDKPAMFSHWARLRSMQDRTKRRGYPSRLANKVKIAAPYLPDWAGDSVYVDPLRKFFPFEEFMGPIQELIGDRQDLDRQAEWMLQRWINEGEISEADALAAVQNKNETWNRAVTAVEADQQNGADYNWVNTIMQPALYLSLPKFLMTGKTFEGREDMGLMPITRTGLGIEAATKATPLEGIGNLVGNVLSGPEMMLRRKQGLDEFGDWGDYKVDRTLSNMAADGSITVSQAITAMIERKGEAYEQAKERVRYEIGVGVPGAGVSQSLLKGQAWKDPGSFIMATMFGWLPHGLLPEGELQQRGIANIYKDARDEWNAGNTEALTDFFEKYPEYETRLALFDEPDERLRQMLISEVFDRYFSLDSSLHKQQVREQLGDDFQDFLGSKNHNDLDPETLAVWSRMLGGVVPEAPPIEDIATMPDIMMDRLDLAPESHINVIDTYRQLRNERFPNWYAWQSWYFSYPKGSPQRKRVLEQAPWLKEYWDWNRGYKEQYPIIKEYTTTTNDNLPDYSWLQDVSQFTIKQLFTYYGMGMPLKSGAMEELLEVWEHQGQPGTFESWLDNYVKQGVAP